MKKAVLILSVVLLLALVLLSKRPDDLFYKVCSADEALEAAKQSRTVVIQDMRCTSGADAWADFWKSAENGEAASVLCAHYYNIDKAHMSRELYEQEKNQYPCLFFVLVEYDGKSFAVTTRESTVKKPEHTDKYKYLVHYTGNGPEQAVYDTYDYYVLVDDRSVTWDEITKSMLSSQFTENMTKHYTVYMNID